jgi:DNA repair protein RadC
MAQTRDKGLEDPRAPFTRRIDNQQTDDLRAPSKPRAKPADASEAPEPAPHYHGHRERLRTRFLQGGVDALQDYELMELVLFRAIPRRDVKPLAKEVIAHFGGFAEAIAADYERLAEVKGLSEAAATEFKIVEAAALKLAQGRLAARPAISSWNQLTEYCRAAMGFQTIEQFRVLFLDTRNQLIADEVQQTGTVNHTASYPREIVKRALELGASAIILVHNHPSGDATPSSADIKMTKEIVHAAKAMHIEVHDHLVIGSGEPASFRSLGLM